MKNMSMVLKYSHCFETLEEARAEIERLHELAFSKKPAAVADGANAQKCFWPNGCSDSYRCTLAGQCVAAWQNQHKEQLRKQITPPAEPSAEGDVS